MSTKTKPERTELTYKLEQLLRNPKAGAEPKKFARQQLGLRKNKYLIRRKAGTTIHKKNRKVYIFN